MRIVQIDSGEVIISLWPDDSRLLANALQVYAERVEAQPVRPTVEAMAAALMGVGFAALQSEVVGPKDDAALRFPEWAGFSEQAATEQGPGAAQAADPAPLDQGAHWPPQETAALLAAFRRLTPTQKDAILAQLKQAWTDQQAAPLAAEPEEIESESDDDRRFDQVVFDDFRGLEEAEKGAVVELIQAILDSHKPGRPPRPAVVVAIIAARTTTADQPGPESVAAARAAQQREEALTHAD